MNSKGELMLTVEAAVKAGISKSTLDMMAKNGYVKKYKINGNSFVHYRDLLRGAWEFEQAKTKHGVVNDAKRSKGQSNV